MTNTASGGASQAFWPAGADPHAIWLRAAALFSGDTGTVLQRVVDLGRQLAGDDAALILLHDQESGAFMPAVPSVGLGLDERWLRREGVGAAQALAARAAAAHDLLEDDAGASAELPFLQSGQRPAAALAVPLEIDGAPIAVLELLSAAPCRGRDLAALRSFAGLAARAVVNAREREREQTIRAQMEALDEASRALAAELALDHVLQRIVEVAARIAGARYGALGVAGPDGYLTEFITTGLSPEERSRIGPLPRGHGLLGMLIRDGQPVRVPNINRDPRRIGFPPHHPPMSSLLGVPIRVRSQVVGDLYLTEKIGAPEFSADDQRLIEMLAAHAGIAIENARLYGHLRELTALRERERIGRDLHDGIIQDLYAASLQLEDIATDVEDVGARDHLIAVADSLTGIIGDVRAYILGLRARRLQGRALEEALESLVHEAAGGQGPRATFAMEGPPRQLSEGLTGGLLQIAREALSNAARHAAATQVDVCLVYAPHAVALTIQDDGQGFDKGALHGEEHHGLRNLRARVEELGGTLHIRSAPGAGTTVEAHVPAGQ